MYDIARSHWNVLVEVGNEPEYNHIDVVAVMQGVNRHGVLSAYGLDPARGTDRHAEERIPVLDYGTAHDLERDFEHSPRITKDAWDWQNRFGVPFVSDEPIGFIDPGHPDFVSAWNRSDRRARCSAAYSGGGARTTNCDVILSAAAIAYLLTPGYTFHMQAGLEGWRPSDSEELQDACAKSLAEIAAFIPRERSSGSRRARTWRLRPRLEGRPHAESLVDRAYGVVLGNAAVGGRPDARAKLVAGAARTDGGSTPSAPSRMC